MYRLTQAVANPVDLLVLLARGARGGTSRVRVTVVVSSPAATIATGIAPATSTTVGSTTAATKVATSLTLISSPVSLHLVESIIWLPGDGNSLVFVSLRLQRSQS